MDDSRADQSVDAIFFVAFAVDRLQKCISKMYTSNGNVRALNYHHPCCSKSIHN